MFAYDSSIKYGCVDCSSPMEDAELNAVETYEEAKGIAKENILMFPEKAPFYIVTIVMTARFEREEKMHFSVVRKSFRIEEKVEAKDV